MELIIEISDKQADELHISSSRLTFEELRRKIAGAELIESLEKSQQTAKEYGIDEWTTDEINNLIQEAKSGYNDKSSD